MSNRTFEDAPAVREQVPLVVGLMGPSGGGKTFSAHRLAAGIQRVVGGEVFTIDTEARRSLHYADRFKFRHVPFTAPFGPLDYLSAIEHCQRRGAKIVIVDSMSHEHEGPGGVLEQHESEMERLSKAWGVKPSVTQMAAWSKPKTERRRLINTILQLPLNFIFCFRAKEKLRIVRGKDPEPRGFMPLAGEEFIYEMAVCALLPPNADGFPQWHTDYPDGEGLMIKLPGQFKELLNPGGRAVQLSEATGEQLATWAAGGTEATEADIAKILGQIAKASSTRALNEAAMSAKALRLSPEQHETIKAALEAKRAAKASKAEELSEPNNTREPGEEG